MTRPAAERGAENASVCSTRYPAVPATPQSVRVPFYRPGGCSGPHIAPRAAMIAEDFCRLRVLARSPQPGSARGYLSQKQEHSPAYGGASMCAQTAKRPARARPAQFVSATTSGHSEVVQTKQTTFVNSMSGLVQYAGWPHAAYRVHRTVAGEPRRPRRYARCAPGRGRAALTGSAPASQTIRDPDRPQYLSFSNRL